MEHKVHATSQQHAEGSKPIEIPMERRRNTTTNEKTVSDKIENPHLMRYLEDESKPTEEQHKANKETNMSPQENRSDDEFHLPHGSPSFTTVMNELSVDLSQNIMHHRHEETPISPLALNDNHDMLSSESASPESKSPPVPADSPTMIKKRLGSARMNVQPRNRSHSWNYRNKMAADRRKQLATLTLPQHNEPSSTHSSPLVLRKKKTKSQPSTPQLLVHAFPKYKFVTETISVSHEDIVREQERERHLADGYAEVTAASIFANPALNKFGSSPEQ